MRLVGLYKYRKMMHGAYNVKLNMLVIFCTYVVYMSMYGKISVLQSAVNSTLKAVVQGAVSLVLSGSLKEI